MSRLKDIDYFMGINYQVTLYREKDLYYFLIPELSLIAEGKTINDAYDKLEIGKKDFFNKAIKLGIEDTVKKPASRKIRNKLLQNLLSFLTKSLIILICLIAIFSFMLKSLPIITHSIGNIPRESYSLAVELSTNFFVALDNMSDEDRKIIIEKIRIRYQQIKPFIYELRALLNETAISEIENLEKVPKNSKTEVRP